MASRFKINGAAVATVAAVAAIILGIIDSRQTRAHNRLSVAPYLVVDYSLSAQPGQSSYAVQVTNEGVGPAIIDSMTITLPGQFGGRTYSSWNDVAILLRERGARVPSYWNFKGGEALGVQRGRELIRVTASDSVRDALVPLLSEIDVRVTYHSIYGETRTAGLKQ